LWMMRPLLDKHSLEQRFNGSSFFEEHPGMIKELQESLAKIVNIQALLERLNVSPKVADFANMIKVKILVK
jgi:DNA mismatch repair ATPase MutS